MENGNWCVQSRYNSEYILRTSIQHTQGVGEDITWIDQSMAVRALGLEKRNAMESGTDVAFVSVSVAFTATILGIYLRPALTMSCTAGKVPRQWIVTTKPDKTD